MDQATCWKLYLSMKQNKRLGLVITFQYSLMAREEGHASKVYLDQKLEEQYSEVYELRKNIF